MELTLLCPDDCAAVRGDFGKGGDTIYGKYSQPLKTTPRLERGCGVAVKAAQ